MSAEPLEPLTPAIVDLLARERRGYPDDAPMMADVLSRVELAVALAPPPPPGGPGGSAPGGSAPGAGAAALGLKKVVGVAIVAFAVGGAVGGGVASSVISSRTVPTPAPSSMATVATRAREAPDAEVTPMIDPVASAAGTASAAGSARAAGSSSAPAPSGIASSRGDLVKERELLDVARAELARGRAADAIAVAERHAQKWPRGFLAEEREVVLIQALAASGRRDEAVSRAARFRKSFPSSMLLPAVDTALAPRSP